MVQERNIYGMKWREWWYEGYVIGISKEKKEGEKGLWMSLEGCVIL